MAGILGVIASGKIASGGGGAPTGTSWVTGQSLGSVASDFTGEVGCSFTTDGSGVTVTALGMWKVTGASNTHVVTIYDFAGTAIVSGTVDLSGGTVGSFVYVAVTPTALAASTNYYLVARYTNGGDGRYDDATTVTTTGEGALLSSIFRANSVGAFNTSNANKTFGPVSFLY